MLTIYFVAVFSLFIGFSTGFSSCVYERRGVCKPLMKALSMPKTADEIENQCQNLLELGTCMLGVTEKCKEDEKYINATKHILSYTENTCKPDNEIYKVIKNNFECVTSELYNLSSCELAIETMVEQNMTAFDETSRCASAAWQILCIGLSNEEQCGREAKDAVVDILMNTDFELLTSCTEEEINAIPVEAEIFATFARKVQNVEDLGNTENKKK